MQKVGSALRLPKLLPNRIPCNDSLLKYCTVHRSMGYLPLHGARGSTYATPEKKTMMEGRVGAKGGGRGDREKRGRAVSLWFSSLAGFGSLYRGGRTRSMAVDDL